jgi:hypothetical protein
MEKLSFCAQVEAEKPLEPRFYTPSVESGTAAIGTGNGRSTIQISTSLCYPDLRDAPTN